MDSDTRVKYYPPNDLACGHGIEKIEEIYKKNSMEITEINDALEFYNFYLYFDNKNLIWKK